MELFPVNIFPQGSLSGSVITTVWIGVSVVCIFNLRLGWVLSGLVIPGYLVPLLLLKPWSASVVLAESLVTYFLVWFFSEYLSRWAAWSNFFGRDRFFAIVLCSVVIRLIGDVWLLPALGEWVNQHWQLTFDYRNQLHSVGLIIVALIANQFWKTGFFRGIVPFSVTLLLTLVIVRYGLMELTNFSLSNIGYLYEDMASSMLASPKAYIILISTALLASRMNLHYGWDFNGILIPSLLALQWYQPVKIFATIFESIVILLLVTLLLKTPWLNRITIEGARKLLLFFNVSFFYKIILSYALLTWFPEFKTTDAYGFGYLLSTLMAVKIHEKTIFARLTRATLQTSLVAVMVATVVGFSLTQLPVAKLFKSTDQLQLSKNEVALEPLKDNLASVAQNEKLALYEVRLNGLFRSPEPTEISLFSDAIISLKVYIKDRNPEKLTQAIDLLTPLNYRVSLVQSRYLYLHEVAPVRGWGLYILDLQPESRLSLAVPAPLEVPGVFDAGLNLFDTLKASSLAIAGTSPRKAMSQYSVLVNTRSFFHEFHRIFGRQDSIQIRGYTQEIARALMGSRRKAGEIELGGLESALWLKRSVPDGLDMIKLKQLVDAYAIEWNEPAFQNLQRQVAREGFGELILTQAAIKKLLFRPLIFQQNVKTLEQDLRIDGYLQEWILDSKEQIAEKGSGAYKKPTQQELLYMDEQVLTPLLGLIEQYRLSQAWSEEDLEHLRIIAQSAQILGYQVIRYKHRATQQEYLILAENADRSYRHWGAYVFRLANANNYLIQIPRPLFEINSFEYGVALFERLKAKALLISTTDPHANLDKSSDLVNLENKINVMNLVNQVLLREFKSEPAMVLSSRAFSYKLDQPLSDADVLYANANGTAEQTQITALERTLFDALQADGLTIQKVDGSEQTIGYEVGKNAQTLYLNATENKQLASLWLSPFARARYRQQDENQWQIMQFRALAIPAIAQDLAEYVQNARWQVLAPAESEAFRLLARAYAEEQDVIRLQQLATRINTGHYRATRLVDVNGKQAFLLIHHSNGALAAIANLNSVSQQTKLWLKDWPVKPQIAEFIDQRMAWLELANGMDTQ